MSSSLPSRTLRCVLPGVALCLSLLFVAWHAGASVQRFAVVVGNNQGHRGDAPLRYADSDAAKVVQVIRDLGGFEPMDIVLLRNADAGTVRRTLIEVNDRIRTAQALPSTETLLFVYYSGHADGRALRLGDTDLALRELAQLVRGSAAKFRLLVVDARRAGERAAMSTSLAQASTTPGTVPAGVSPLAEV